MFLRRGVNRHCGWREPLLTADKHSHAGGDTSIAGINFFLSGNLRRFLKSFFADATFLTEKNTTFHSLKQFEGKKHENKCFFIIFIVKFLTNKKTH